MDDESLLPFLPPLLKPAPLSKQAIWTARQAPYANGHGEQQYLWQGKETSGSGNASNNIVILGCIGVSLPHPDAQPLRQSQLTRWR